MRNLEVYFSKLPKSCLECPCFQNYEMCCGLDDGTQDYFKDEIDGGKCPLKKFHSKATTQNKLKIVREVCEKIRTDLQNGLKKFKPKPDDILTQFIYNLDNKLDQLQKEQQK